MDSVSYRRHIKAGKPDSIRVTYSYGFFEEVSEWICPDHGGYAAGRYQARKSLLGADANTTDDALDEVRSWKKPSRIKVKPSSHNPKYKEIVEFDYTQVEKKHEAKTQGGYADLSDLEDIPF